MDDWQLLAEADLPPDARDVPVVLRRGVRGRRLPPPGLAAAMLARGLVVQLGRDARRSSANVRHPATTQVEAVQPFALDGLPGTPPAGHPPWSVLGRAFGACCFAGKLRSPCPPAERRPHPARLRGLDPYVNGYVNPFVIVYALGVRTPGFGGRGCLAPQGSGADRPSGCASRD
jgi:hypothetical protein